MKQLSAIALFLFAGLSVHAQTITSVGTTWSPAELTVTAGTPITITIVGTHDMREVSEDTWNANGTLSNGGFEFLVGTHTLTLDIPGTYWYVCVPHVANFGMKGKIIVETNTGIDEEALQLFAIAPNPASLELLINSATETGSQLALIDMDGREVLRQTLLGDNRIAIGHLAAGNYIVVLLNAAGARVAQERITIVR